MWRTVGSIALTFAALAWAIISVALCFFYGASFWNNAFGRFGAFYGAVFALGLCFWGAKLLLRLADRLIEPYSGAFDASAYSNSPRDNFHRDWRRYADDIGRRRRYAFYMRTRQWERAAAADAEITASNAMDGGAPPEPPHPRRTSMGHRVPFEEQRRGTRRYAHTVPRMTNWRALDD